MLGQRRDTSGYEGGPKSTHIPKTFPSDQLVDPNPVALRCLRVERAMGIEYIAHLQPINSDQRVKSDEPRRVRIRCENSRHTSQLQPMGTCWRRQGLTTRQSRGKRTRQLEPMPIALSRSCLSTFRRAQNWDRLSLISSINLEVLSIDGNHGMPRK